MSPATSLLVNWGGASLPTTGSLLLIALLYVLAWRVLSRSMPGTVPVWRAGAFLAGLAMLWLAWSARLSALTHVLLIAHMAQHLLFMLFAPPLLLLGSPVLVFARGLTHESRPHGLHASTGRSQSPRSIWARRAARCITHPVPAGAIMVVITIAWHVPSDFALAMGSRSWHAAENLTFFASGLLFWWPVILPWPAKPQWPRWTVPLYLLGADLPVSVLTAYLAFCGYVVYPAYLAASRPFAISALDDQVAAAMLMWVAMLTVFLGAAAFVVVDLLEPSWHLESNAQGK